MGERGTVGNFSGIWMDPGMIKLYKISHGKYVHVETANNLRHCGEVIYYEVVTLSVGQIKYLFNPIIYIWLSGSKCVFKRNVEEVCILTFTLRYLCIYNTL